jgi:hypothetical protein
MPVRCVSPGNALIIAVFSALLAFSVVMPVSGQGAAHAMRLGGDEQPLAAKARFDGVGRIECRAAGGRAAVVDATGWVLAAADTVVTAAHSFYPADGAIDPRACVFRLYGADGSTRQAARIRYVRSPWSEASHRNDSAHDIAILKLDRPMKVAAIPSAATPRLGARPVRLISYPADVGDRQARISRGEARPFPLAPARDAEAGMRVSDPSRLFATSIDSAAGSSGGMYYAPGSGAAIGVHVGYVCGGPGGDCFNFGLRFDGKILAMIAAVAADSGPARRTELASAAF